MKKWKQALSLTLALVMSLALTIPALGAEPSTYKNGVIQITNVLSYELKDEWNAAFTCIAPVKVTPGDVFDRTECTVETDAAKIPDDAELTLEDYYRYAYEGGDGSAVLEGESAILVEPGRYMVEIWETMSEGGGGFTRYLVTVLEDTPKPADPPATTDPSTTTPVESVVAMPTNDKLTVNGQPADPTVYKIGGSNYFKIRDVAALLNGTEKQFDVGYDNAVKSVTVETGKGYDKEPTDLAGAATGGSQTAAPSNDAIYVNGEKIDAEVYKIGGGNYFKLRDLGKALNFYVGWEQGTGMYIDTSKPYSE